MTHPDPRTARPRQAVGSAEPLSQAAGPPRPQQLPRQRPAPLSSARRSRPTASDHLRLPRRRGPAALPRACQPRGLRHVLVRHEENAALAADGFARATGFPGVCLATSGPGATNLLTGIATAMMDSVPVLALTGQVATSVIGTQAFQEVDIVGMARPVVKAAFQARAPEDVPGLVAEAFRIMREGRPARSCSTCRKTC